MRVSLPRLLPRAYPYRIFDYPTIDTMMSEDVWTGKAHLEIIICPDQVDGCWIYEADGVQEAHNVMYRAAHLAHNPFIMSDYYLRWPYPEEDDYEQEWWDEDEDDDEDPD